MKTKLRLHTVAFIVFLFGVVDAYSQSFLTHRDAFQLINWKFYKGDIHSAERGSDIWYDGWEDVAVPHTWNAKDVLTEGAHYYQGIGWYRGTFNVPVDDKDKRHFVRFEGVSMVADVFLNGTYLGKHKGGYSAFCFEITPHIRRGELNYIAVKVDNSVQPDVAPSGTDLYPLFGGIYRPATVFSTSEFCISPLDYASSGVYINPVSVSDKAAEIEVATLIDYHKALPLITTSPELLPPNGKNGKGLYGRYFSNPYFKGKPKHARIDKQISFQYGIGGPFDDMPSDGFSMIWTGRFIPEKTGLYQFVLNSDDGSRLYLGGERVINHWGDHAAHEKWGEIRLEAGKEMPVKIEYYENRGDASIIFGWKFIDESDEKVETILKITVTDRTGKMVVKDEKKIALKNNQKLQHLQKLRIDHPHLWDAKRGPYLYKLSVRVEDLEGNLLDAVEQPLGIRYFEVDRDKGLILNGKHYHLYGVCRHQEWEGLGHALTDEHHEKDVEMILELGANGVRLAHYQHADKMYSLCDENGLVVWAEIPNTPTYRGELPAYLQNCRDQLTELIKQNYNHPSILFWGLYNEIPIPEADLKILHETAKQIDPYRLTTLADNTQAIDKHFVTDIAAWNWYFGWYYGQFGEYANWYNNLHYEYPNLIAGLSEYGAGGSISQQQESPERPDASNGRFFPEQYQRLYHEQVWSEIKDRKDIWCKFLWNMFDFSWTNVRRGDRDFINHKGLITHDRKVKKDAFYFYKANWSDEPVLYILSKRNTEHVEAKVPVSVYTNLDAVELYVNGELISKKKMDSNIYKISWSNVKLIPGRNQISAIGYKGNKKYTDACEWKFIIKN